MYDKINLWYRQGLWSAAQVLHAVEKHVLTESEAAEIIQYTSVDSKELTNENI